MACTLLIINFLNPIFVLMSDCIFYSIEKTVVFIGRNDKGGEVVSQFIYIQIAELIEFIGSLIYLELIELRFCGLNKNIKRNIRKRGDNEIVENTMNLNEYDSIQDHDDNNSMIL